MAKAGTRISVRDEIGVLKDVLVQGPVCRPLGGSGLSADHETHHAEQQHAGLVRELEARGVTVRHFDTLLYSALGFADARDWLLERRIAECEDDRRRSSEIISWLSEQPVERLTRYLMDGMQASELPRGFLRSSYGVANPGGWYLPPQRDQLHPRGLVRFLDGGAMISQPEPAASRAAAINISAVLNFAPLFDESRFDFWLTADGADRALPPIDGNDVAMPGGSVCVGAITAATSAHALALLSASLFRQNKAQAMFWLDLAAIGCSCLDDCFLPLSRTCLLVDMRVLSIANVFKIRPNGHNTAVGIEPCKADFLAELADALGLTGFEIIDVSRHSGGVGQALACLAPVVLEPGRIIAFEEHRAAFRLLEDKDIEVVSALPGAALSRKGRGPRRLVTALHAD